LLGVDLEPPSSAKLCGDCHRTIHEGWERSAHAAAMESRLFQDALKLAESDFGLQSPKVSRGCHSPIAVQTGDLRLIKKVSWGRRDLRLLPLHSQRGDLGGNPRGQVEFSLVRSGPSKEAVSTAHRTAYSAVHTSSLACLVCHEYRNETFTFPAPPGIQTQVEATFYYYYSAISSTAAQQQVKFLSLRRLAP
jgi:hypothetical protein